MDHSWKAANMLALAALLCAPSPASADAPAQAAGRKATIQRGAAGAGTRVSVLIHLSSGADRAAVRDFARRHGGQVRYQYSLLPNVLNLRNVPESALAELERARGVQRIERDAIGRIHLNDSTPLVQARKDQVQAAGFAANGAGTRICIVDTGIDSDNFMYANRIDAVAGRDFVNNDNDPEDDHGHGSHVAGIAAGGDDDPSGVPNQIDSCGVLEPFQGVAWEATLIGVKVVDALGQGFLSDLIAGVDYCADQSAAGARADVINLSLGIGSFPDTCDTDSFAAATNAAADKGVVVVASSGNSAALDMLPSPACASKVMAVGAVYDDDYSASHCDTFGLECFEWCTQSDGICGCIASCVDCNPAAGEIACFSNRSRLLGVVAPGCITFSADVSNSANGATGLCGTSMAAPHVAGLAALLLSEGPGQSPARIRKIIRDGAIEPPADTTPGFDATYGHGLIHALNSLAQVSCGGSSDCDDGDACTLDSCDASSECVNAPNPSCVTCRPANQGCTTNADCCSRKCTGKPQAKTCR